MKLVLLAIAAFGVSAMVARGQDAETTVYSWMSDGVS